MRQRRRVAQRAGHRLVPNERWRQWPCGSGLRCGGQNRGVVAKWAVRSLHGVADIEVLDGGIANAGAVVRHGDHVLRPSSVHTPTIHAFLRFLRDEGFEAASRPIGVDADGRERLRSSRATSRSRPTRRGPRATWRWRRPPRCSAACMTSVLATSPPPGATWSAEMADPDTGGVSAAGLVICHNDVCLENLVYRDRVAVGLVDFDFAAPGRRVHDLATFARMNVPIDTDEDAALLGRCGPFEPMRRLRVVADAYGLPPGRAEFLDALADGVQRGGQFLQRRLDEGNVAFRQMVEATGGMAKFDRRRAWFTAHRDRSPTPSAEPSRSGPPTPSGTPEPGGQDHHDIDAARGALCRIRGRCSVWSSCAVELLLLRSDKQRR